MADEFGQLIRGLHSEGDAVVSTDTHGALLVKDNSGNYAFPELDASGLLKVTGGVQYAVNDAAGASDTGTLALVVRDDTLSTLTPVDGDYVQLRVDSVGALWTTVSGTVTVTASDLDIRNLDHTTDDVRLGDGTTLTDVLAGTNNALYTAITDGTETLAINPDGSINVSTDGAGADNTFLYGSDTAVKDTIVTVVTESPGVDTNYKAVYIAAPGFCEWDIEFGTTASESTIIKAWTTPSSPTLELDIPDSLVVSSGETFRVRATNREKKNSPQSDFTASATLVKQA